jgi:8-oxo-dGTP pyrophosphatase MutT (NUDIX family)
MGIDKKGYKDNLVSINKGIDKMTDIKASGTIIIHNGKMLVLKETKYKDSWIQAGGKKEGDERPEDTAKRETFEETGLNLDDDGFTEKGFVDVKSFRTYIYETDTEPVVDISEDDNVLEYKWIDIKDQSTKLHFRLKTALSKALNQSIISVDTECLLDTSDEEEEVVIQPPVKKVEPKKIKQVKKNIKVNHMSMKGLTESRLEFTDKVNVKKARYIYNQDMNTFKHTFWTKLEVDENGRGRDLKTFYKEVRKFCAEVIRNKVDGEDFALIKRRYRFCNSKNGRIYSKGFGIQSLQGNLRKFLTGDYLLDIDIKNAHPNILYGFVKDYNKNHEDKLPMFYLENYVKNREKVLKDNNTNKVSVLICLNSDEIQTNKKNKGFYTKNPYLVGFHKEKMKIYKKLIKNTDFVKLHGIESDNQENPISSIVNKMFCIKENDLIQKVMDSDICVPMFDGFMFDKADKDKYDHLLEETGIIRWDYKDNTDFEVDMSDYDEDASLDYESIKEKFERDNCMIISPLIFLKRIKNEEGKLEDRYYQEQQIKTICKPWKVMDEEGKERKFYDMWIEDYKRRQYETMMFNPYSREELDDTPDHVYNTFNEFDVSYLDDYEEPTWFLDFIDNLSDNEPQTREYLLNYCSDFFQRPNINCEIALVLRGESGIGKDTFIEILEEMMGKLNDYTYRTTNINDILPAGQGFNSSLKNKLLVQFNEVEGKDGSSAKERIKDHTTRKTNNIHEKYINSYKQKNNAQIIFCSNNNSPVQFAFDERRFVMIKCGDKMKQNKKYWDSVYENINSREKLNELYSYLMNRDISSWSPVEDRPKTKAYNIAISNAVPYHIRWMKELFTEGYDLNDQIEYQEIEQKTTKSGKQIAYGQVKDIYYSYKNWAVENHYIKNDDFKSGYFKKLLQDFKGVEFDKRVKIKGKSTRVVYFDLDIINKIFDKYVFDVSEGEDEDELNLDDL